MIIDEVVNIILTFTINYVGRFRRGQYGNNLNTPKTWMYLHYVNWFRWDYWELWFRWKSGIIATYLSNCLRGSVTRSSRFRKQHMLDQPSSRIHRRVSFMASAAVIDGSQPVNLPVSPSSGIQSIASSSLHLSLQKNGVVPDIEASTSDMNPERIYLVPPECSSLQERLLCRTPSDLKRL